MAEPTVPSVGPLDPAAAADHVAIGHLQAVYADVVNRRAWDELHGLFLDDTTVVIDTVTREPVEVTGPAAFASFVSQAMARFEFLEFVMLSSRIELAPDGDADHASARLYMCEIRRDVGTLDWSTAYGVYHDRYLRTSGGWRFARRDYRSLTRTDGEVFPFPHHLGF
jgi:hypothetical protein